MFCLSQIMTWLPVGVTYTSFAEICMIATSIVGVIKFNQVQSTATTIGLFFIIASVVMVNLLCQTSPKKTDEAVETTPRDGSA